MILVQKLNGTSEPYNEGKLRLSLQKAGASSAVIEDILQKVSGILHNGIETKALFHFVFEELKRHHPVTSARYNIKQALLQLGPEGFPFEKFVAHILAAKGYRTRTNQIVQGTLIPHEIDIVAETSTEKLMVECKHHLKPWDGCNIQTALYVYARYLDVQEYFTAPMLVTNTKFSPQIILYAKGIQLRLMGWKYSAADSLEYNIDRYKLYPITMLTSLDPHTARILLSNGIVLIKELEQDLLLRHGIHSAKAQQLCNEAQVLMHHEQPATVP